MLLISNTYWMGMPFNYKGELPENTQREPVYLRAQDMRETAGVFYTPDQTNAQNIAVLVMHPKVDFTRHYCIPGFLRAGIAVLGMTTRCLHNDATAIHEDLLLDVAAAVTFLKEQRGFDQVVLFGNSGGGALFAMYQAQAQKPEGDRLAFTPAGDATKLPKANLIPGDAFVAISVHRGEGEVLQEAMDPAVVDESDPRLTNDAMDMYHPDNGFVPPPKPSTYSAEFVAQFRAGQKARVQRLDSMAQSMVDEARHYERLYKSSKESLDFHERHKVGRLGATERVMVVYRTMANLHYTDPTLDPSSRHYGSLLSDRPDLMNQQYMGFGRICRPEAWLSTWSSLSSNANLVRNMSEIAGVPVFYGYANKDKEIYPKEDAAAIREAITVADKCYRQYEAEHYFEPEFGVKSAPDVERLMDDVVPWVLERFGR